MRWTRKPFKKVTAQNKTKTQGRVLQLEKGNCALEIAEIICLNRYFCGRNVQQEAACDLVLKLKMIPNAVTTVNEGQPYNENQNVNKNQNENQNHNEND